MTTRVPATLPAPLADVVATALGEVHRDDPVGRRFGGAAGNARLTAWTGLVLLVAFVAEGVTLLSLHRLIGVHVFLGALLVPLALLKTVTTGWRILRYYSGNADYRQAGPPPMLLRLLGPLVILTSLAVLGTGLALVAVGRDVQPLATVAGQRLDPVTLHKVTFVLWLAAVGVHTAARLVPAVLLVGDRVRPRVVPGGVARVATLVVVTAAGVVVGIIVLAAASDWTQHQWLFDGNGG